MAKIDLNMERIKCRGRWKTLEDLSNDIVAKLDLGVNDVTAEAVAMMELHSALRR